MGARAYILRRVGSRWQYLYSHWGAASIKDYFRLAFTDREKVSEYKNAMDFIEKRIQLEEDKGETWHDVEDIKKFINLKDIAIEAYIVLNGSKAYVIFPFITTRTYGGLVADVFDDSYENFRTLQMYERLHSFVRVADISIDSDEIKRAAIHYFSKYYYDSDNFRLLEFDKISDFATRIMCGEVMRII